MLNRGNRKRRDTRRLPRLKGFSLARLIPGMITVAATCAGLTGVRYAIDGLWEFAVMAIIAAAILDALDGRMARLLDASSSFGEQLDSLSDVIAFGVCPAFILWFWGLQVLGGFGWALALFFVVCCGLRLARFNQRLDSLPPYAYNYFQGVPAPAGALLALLPMVISFEFGPGIHTHPVAISVWTTVMALAMVGEFPTYSFKKLRLAPRYILPTMAAVGLALAGLAGAPWKTLIVVAVLYMASFALAARSYMRLRQEADNLRNTDGDGDGDGESSDGAAGDGVAENPAQAESAKAAQNPDANTDAPAPAPPKTGKPAPSATSAKTAKSAGGARVRPLRPVNSGRD